MSITYETHVYEVTPGLRRLMNTIKTGSRFASMKWTESHTISMSDPETQMRAAQGIVQGWRTNGNKPDAKYEIEQVELR